MSKQHANKQAGKNINSNPNSKQTQNRQASTEDRESQRRAGAKGTLAHDDDQDVDNEQIGNADETSGKGYQASGRFQQNDLEDDEVGNRAQNQNYDRAVQGSANRNPQQSDDTRGRMAGSKDSKDSWADKSGKAMNSDKQTPQNRNFNAGSKDTNTNDKDSQRRASGKGDTSSSKR